MSVNYALVDDTDGQSISYDGQWSILPPNGAELAYDNQTLHGSQVAGSTAKISFQGSQISVFGNVDPPELSGVLPNVTYSLDGSTPMSFLLPSAPPQAPNVNYRQTLYVSPQVPDGRHTLVITLQNNLSASSYWLDYSLFVPSPQTLPSVETIIDDRDSAGRVVYNPPSSWIQTPGVQQEFESTTTFSNTPNTTATIKFNGTRISFYGTVVQDSTGPGLLADASFSTSIDNIPPATHPLPFPNATLYNAALFDSGNLADGSHTLTVTVLSGRPLHLDYFLLQQSAQSAASPGTPAPSGIPTAAAKVKAKTNVGAIAGGIVAALAALAAIIVAILLLRRRKQRADAAARPTVDMIGPERQSLMDPFHAPPSSGTAASLLVASTPSEIASSPLPSHARPSAMPSSPYIASSLDSKAGRSTSSVPGPVRPLPSPPQFGTDFAPPPYV